MGENKFESPIQDLKGKIDTLHSEGKWAVACYVPVFGVVVSVIASVRMVNSKFVLFHARQGIVIFAFNFIAMLVGIFAQSLALMIWGVALMLYFAGMFIALSKKMTAIPVVKNFADMIPEKFLFERLTGETLDEEEPNVESQDNLTN